MGGTKPEIGGGAKHQSMVKYCYVCFCDIAFEGGEKHITKQEDKGNKKGGKTKKEHTYPHTRR